jgi:hypothetical protein
MCTLAEIEPARSTEIRKRVLERIKIDNHELFQSEFNKVHLKLKEEGKIIQIKKGVYVLKYIEKLTLGPSKLMLKLNNARFFYLKNSFKNKRN